MKLESGREKSPVLMGSVIVRYRVAIGCMCNVVNLGYKFILLDKIWCVDSLQEVYLLIYFIQVQLS